MGSPPSILVRDRDQSAPQLPEPKVIIPLACLQGPADALPAPALPPAPGDMPVIPAEPPAPSVPGLSARLSLVQQALAVTQWRLSVLEVQVPALRQQRDANIERMAECQAGLGSQMPGGVGG
jgi:hypothetical protein